MHIWCSYTSVACFKCVLAKLLDNIGHARLCAPPPHRCVAVDISKLQLGVTLKPTATNGFELDLRTPDAHKTAAIFGPSTTAVPAAACALLTAWLAEAGLTASTAAATKPYVFVLGWAAERPEPTSSRIILRLSRLSAAVLAVRWVDSVCLRCWVW